MSDILACTVNASKKASGMGEMGPVFGIPPALPPAFPEPFWLRFPCNDSISEPIGRAKQSNVVENALQSRATL
jgi:hypothetical protein